MNRWYLSLLVASILAAYYLPLPAVADAPAAGGDEKPRPLADADHQAGKQYTATAYLRVRKKPPYVVYLSPERDVPSDFAVYKATQEQLVKSRFVVAAALRDIKAKDLPTLQREEDRGRAISWLTSHLRVGFPSKNSEVMTVSFTAPDAKEAAALANAVVEAYRTEVVDMERNQRVLRKNELDRVCAEKETELRSKKSDLKELADQLGVDDQTRSIKQRLAVQRAVASEKELAALRSDLRRAHGERKVQRAMSADCKRLDIQIEVLEEMLQECQKESEQFVAAIKKLSGKSIDVELMSNEIGRLEEVFSDVSREREKVRVELHAAPRVVLLQKADVPEAPDDPGT